MTGDFLKEKLRAEGVVLDDLAKKLGYRKTQNLHSVLRSDNVKSGIIEDIAHVIGRDVSFFYGSENKSIETSKIASLENVSVPMIAMETILSQQRTIEILATKGVRTNVRVDDAVGSADVG
jgi:hypothetical protein